MTDSTKTIPQPTPPDGYTLYSLGNTRNTYIRHLSEDEFIYLDITVNGTAVLTALVGMISLSTGEMAYPHPKFAMFENQLIKAYLAAKKALGE